MLYEDSTGKLWMPEDIDGLQAWEIDDRGIHVAENVDAY